LGLCARVEREWASRLSGGSGPQIAILLAFLPLVLFCCYQEDFGNLNVLKPKDYLFLVRKTYNAIRDNNWKITAKVHTHTHTHTYIGLAPARPLRGASMDDVAVAETLSRALRATGLVMAYAVRRRMRA
jgi:hypothetical protein